MNSELFEIVNEHSERAMKIQQDIQRRDRMYELVERLNSKPLTVNLEITEKKDISAWKIIWIQFVTGVLISSFWIIVAILAIKLRDFLH